MGKMDLPIFDFPKTSHYWRSTMNSFFTRCLALVIFIIPALGFSQVSSTRKFLIPDHGELVLRVPQAWKDGLRQSPDKLPPTITFSPSSGAPFKVMVTAGGGANPGMQAPDMNTLRQQVESAAKNIATQAVEKSLKLQELTGPAIHGFYFSATDKAPKKGEYKFVTQGIARVGGIVLVFAIFTNDGQEAIVKAALEMICGVDKKLK
jgi:hypothetical protein